MQAIGQELKGVLSAWWDMPLKSRAHAQGAEKRLCSSHGMHRLLQINIGTKEFSRRPALCLVRKSPRGNSGGCEGCPRL